MLHVRELCGNSISCNKKKVNFQEQYQKIQKSKPIIWKYQGTQRIADVALEHICLDVQTPNGLIETEILALVVLMAPFVVMKLDILENMLLMGYNVIIYGNTYFLKVKANPIAAATDDVSPLSPDVIVLDVSAQVASANVNVETTTSIVLPVSEAKATKDSNSIHILDCLSPTASTVFYQVMKLMLGTIWIILGLFPVLALDSLIVWLSMAELLKFSPKVPEIASNQSPLLQVWIVSYFDGLELQIPFHSGTRIGIQDFKWPEGRKMESHTQVPQTCPQRGVIPYDLISVESISGVKEGK
ncbi:unnamed protein product [Lactuca virosa]|uniref:Uncharacterized protein n=1 Tax=Lactuca virosa TaxID=75947 RepID=A0AAU9LNS5_9ASTR|nr:unnamed protein product [Lactuca virosa]